MKKNKINFPNNSIFLVTGGAGFIGSNLCETLLDMGYKVRCLDNLSTGYLKNIESFLNNPNFSFIKGDIRNYDTCYNACNGVDYVLHQAAWGSVPRSVELPLDYEEINIKGTLNMLEASRRNNIKKFVYASSSSVYGDDCTIPKIEGKEGKLLSPYALTKKVDEEYAKMYSLLYNLDTYGLRYFNVFGKRQDPNGLYAAVIPRFIKQLLNNERPTIDGDGYQSRDFTYIKNVVHANLRACLASKSVSGECFNIAYGGRVSINEIFNIIKTYLNKNIEPIYGPTRIGDIKHSNADITKAKNNLGYAPKWDLNSGLNEYLRWYLENNYNILNKGINND